MTWRILTLIAAVVAVAVGVVAVPAGSSTVTGQEADSRTVALDPDWNLVGWTGPATPIREALASLGDALLSAHTFDNTDKEFRATRRDPRPESSRS